MAGPVRVADAAGDVPRARARGAVTGLLAVGAALATAELVRGAFGDAMTGDASPLVAVGGWVIDHVPPAVKTFAIDTFGTNDKPALIVGTLVLLVAFAAAIGVAASRRPQAAWVGVTGFTVVGVAAVTSRPAARAVDVVPTLLGAVAAIATFRLLAVRPTALRSAPAFAIDRRRFVLGATAVGASSVASATLGTALRRRVESSSARSSVVLPAPVSPALPVPTGVDPPVAGLTSFVTPNADFYRIDTALFVPRIDHRDWRLRIHGMVERELVLTFDDLLARPLIERDITLVCVSNEVGGSYAGNARWLGVSLADLLRDAGVRPGATQLVSRSGDGYTAGSPVAALLDGRDALVAVGMNGEPLPSRHGFPARLVVPGLYGYVSATKWVTELELTTFEDFDPYWARRGWAKDAPIKTMSRIDTPRGLQRVPAGTVPIAGVAWAPHRGITTVEVRIDDGPWQQATLAPVPGADTWRQWVLPWEATPGRHRIACRAVDGDGGSQPEERVPPVPDGATGWHQVVVDVR